MIQYLHGRRGKGLDTVQRTTDEGRSTNSGVLVEHIGQGTGAQLAHALPDAMRGLQGRQAAGHYAIDAIDRHADFPYPAWRAGRQAHAMRLVLGRALRVFAQDSQVDVSQLTQTFGQRSGTQQPILVMGR